MVESTTMKLVSTLLMDSSVIKKHHTMLFAELSAWGTHSASSVPVAVELTYMLLVASKSLEDRHETNKLSEMECRLILASAIHRFVTNLADNERSSQTSSSIAAICDALVVPSELVALRHRIAHRDLPPLDQLAFGVDSALEYVIKNFWMSATEQPEGLTSAGSSFGELANNLMRHLFELSSSLTEYIPNSNGMKNLSDFISVFVSLIHPSTFTNALNSQNDYFEFQTSSSTCLTLSHSVVNSLRELWSSGLLSVFFSPSPLIQTLLQLLPPTQPTAEQFCSFLLLMMDTLDPAGVMASDSDLILSSDSGMDQELINKMNSLQDIVSGQPPVFDFLKAHQINPLVSFLFFFVATATLSDEDFNVFLRETVRLSCDALGSEEQSSDGLPVHPEFIFKWIIILANFPILKSEQHKEEDEKSFIPFLGDSMQFTGPFLIFLFLMSTTSLSSASIKLDVDNSTAAAVAAFLESTVIRWRHCLLSDSEEDSIVTQLTTTIAELEVRDEHPEQIKLLKHLLFGPE